MRLTKKQLVKQLVKGERLSKQDKMIAKTEKMLRVAKKKEDIEYLENEKRQLESEIFLINEDKL